MHKITLAGRTTRSASKQPLRIPQTATEKTELLAPNVPIETLTASGSKQTEPTAISSKQIEPPTASGSNTQSPPELISTTAQLPSFPSSTSLPPSYSSDSNSDLEIAVLSTSNTKTAYMSSLQKTAGLACSIHPVINHPPVFSEGQITPKELMIFEQDCEPYFLNAKGGDPKEQRVARIITAFKDPLIRDWITSNRDGFVALTFEEFMKKLRGMLL